MAKQLKTKLRQGYLNKVSEIESRIQQIIDSFVPAKHLTLVEGKIAWKLMLDILIVGDLDYCEVDLIFYAIRAALQSCTLPDAKVNFNSINNTYSIELLDETVQMFKPEQLPHAFVIGKVGSNYIFDMEEIEYRAVETSFLGVTNFKGELLEFEKIGKQFMILRLY